MSLVYNIATSLWGKKGQRELSNPSDFMVMWGQDSDEVTMGKKQSVEQMKAQLMSIAKIQNSSERTKMMKRSDRNLHKSVKT